MAKQVISHSFYHVKSRDLTGGTVNTEVFKQEDGMYKAFSHYAKYADEDIVGLGEHSDEEVAVRMSRKHLRAEWKRNQVKE